MFTTSCPRWPARRVNKALSSPAARSATGLSVSALLACARMLPVALSSRKAKLFSVARMPVTFFTTVDSSMSEPTTATARPPSSTGRTRLTVRLPVAESGYTGVMAGPPAATACLYQPRAVPS